MAPWTTYCKNIAMLETLGTIKGKYSSLTSTFYLFNFLCKTPHNRNQNYLNNNGPKQLDHMWTIVTESPNSYNLTKVKKKTWFWNPRVPLIKEGLVK